jgi:hypothetical protein
MTTEQFGKQIKTKYPQYKDISDAELGKKMLTKYPQYNDMVKSDQTGQTVKPFLSGHPILKGISDFIGTTGLAKNAAVGVFLKFTPEGKDLMKRIETGDAKYSDLEGIIGGASDVGTKQTIGSAVKTAGTLTALGKAPATALGRVGVGVGVGGAIGAGGALEKGGTAKDVAVGGLVGAGIGGAVSGALEGVGALLRKVSGSNYVAKKVGGTYNKELQPPKKDIAKEIEMTLVDQYTPGHIQR